MWVASKNQVRLPGKVPSKSQGRMQIEQLRAKSCLKKKEKLSGTKKKKSGSSRGDGKEKSRGSYNHSWVGGKTISHALQLYPGILRV